MLIHLIIKNHFMLIFVCYEATPRGVIIKVLVYGFAVCLLR